MLPLGLSAKAKDAILPMLPVPPCAAPPPPAPPRPKPNKASMLELKTKDRVRVLAATIKKSPGAHALRVAVISLSLVLLALPPALGWFRIDLWRGNHVLLNQPVTIFEAMKGFVIAMAILYGFTFFSNIFVGRFFCGWGCPVGYVSRLGEDVDRQKSRRRKVGQHLLGAGFVAAFIGATMTWWVDPRVMLEGGPKARAITVGVFALLTAGGFLHAFKWRFGFCLHACPIGLYYRLVTSKAPVSIVFVENPSKCIECRSCETVCPVNIDPKKLGEEIRGVESIDGPEERYGDAECIRCGDCVYACKMVFAKRTGEVAPLRYGFAKKETSKP